MRHILVTGGFGFIGSNLVRYWTDKYPDDRIVLMDALTYAARPQWVMEHIFKKDIGPRFQHVNADIRDIDAVGKVMRTFQPDHVLHLAAESHVCRSIETPSKFVMTNIVGTFNLLETFKNLWSGHPSENHRFLHVSTDEVYGELPLDDKERKFHEELKYDPRSPYAASKAASDHLVRAYHHTYGLNAVVTNCSNNFGPNQHEEKLIPKTILNLMMGKPVTLYGSGCQVRDWLYVDEHVSALDTVFHKGIEGQTYCIGGNLELTNYEVVDAIYMKMRELGMLERGKMLEVNHTNDRPTDDLRYAIDTTHIARLGWNPRPDLFSQRMETTVKWYSERLRIASCDGTLSSP